jgi:hypothetical protein
LLFLQSISRSHCQIFYAPSLTPAQRTRAYRDFVEAKDQLDHHLWADLPILFTSGQYLPSFTLAGFITIPYNFEVRSLVEYIHRYDGAWIVRFWLVGFLAVIFFILL